MGRRVGRLPLGDSARFRSGSTQCYGEDGSFGCRSDSLYMRTAQAISGRERRPGCGDGSLVLRSSIRCRTRLRINALIEGDDGALLIAKNSGIRQLVDGRAEAYPLPGVGAVQALRLLRDRNGGLWIGTADAGLLHVHQGRTDVFTQPDGLSGDSVTSLFEDREGNIWVATIDGLDRFRDFAVPTISVKQGLSSPRRCVRPGGQGWQHLAWHG